MKTPEELRAFYDGTLRPQMEALEQRRRASVRNGLITAGVLVAAGLLVGVVLASTLGPLLLVFGLIPAAVVGALVFGAMTKQYCRDFKNTVIRQVIEFLEPELRYRSADGIGREQFAASDIFQHSIDRYHSEDLVEGRVGQTTVMFSEIHAEYKTTSGSGKHRQTHWHTIFRGLFFSADFNKHFQGRTVVLPDAAQKLFGGFGQTLQSLNPSRGSLVKLEDPEFEREFVVYGNDQVESRYILSMSLMERIVAFRRKHNAEVYLSFFGSRVVVAIATKENLFEPKLLGTPDFETILRYAAQLRLATDIVDDLNLNTRIWSKA